MTSDLKDFFSLIGKAKKEKEDEFQSLVGDLDIDSMFNQVKVSVAEDKKKKEKEERQVKALESWLFAEPKEEIIVEKKQDDYEELKKEIGSKKKPNKPAVEEIKEDEVVEEEIEEDTIDHALKILDTIKSKEEVREQTNDPEILKIRRELEYLKNLVNMQGGGGEVRLEFLDDVDRDTALVNGKYLQYNSSTKTFVGADASGGGGGGGIAGISTTGTSFFNHLDVSGISTFAGNVSIGGTLTYDDVTNVDSIGIVTARSGVYFGSPVVSAIESNSATTTTTSQTSIDSFSASEYRSAKYQVQITRGSSYQVTEISVVHDGSDSYGTEYATIKTGSSLASFSTDISEGNVRLLATPSSSSSTVFKFTKTSIVV